VAAMMPLMATQNALGIFLVRAWHEEGELRARVSVCLDVNSQPCREFLTADPTELHDQLSAWVRELSLRLDLDGGLGGSLDR
jgi:hypothetical protein